MKYCTKCGTPVGDFDKFCPQCGAQLGSEKPDTQIYGTYNTKPAEKVGPNAVQTIAFVFMILGTITLGFAIIPLAWCIPMTVSYYNRISHGEQVGVGFKVCSFLFVSLIAGILMLVDNDSY